MLSSEIAVGLHQLELEISSVPRRLIRRTGRFSFWVTWRVVLTPVNWKTSHNRITQPLQWDDGTKCNMSYHIIVHCPFTKPRDEMRTICTKLSSKLGAVECGECLQLVLFGGVRPDGTITRPSSGARVCALVTLAGVAPRATAVNHSGRTRTPCAAYKACALSIWVAKVGLIFTACAVHKTIIPNLKLFLCFFNIRSWEHINENQGKHFHSSGYYYTS